MQELNELILEKQEELNDYKQMVIDNSTAYYGSAFLVDEWADKKEDRSGKISISDNYVGVNIDLRLDENDTVSEHVNLFVEHCEKIFEELDLFFADFSEHAPGKWMRYHYRSECFRINLHLLFHYENAKTCKVIGSGEFEEKLIRVCT